MYISLFSPLLDNMHDVSHAHFHHQQVEYETTTYDSFNAYENITAFPCNISSTQNNLLPYTLLSRLLTSQYVFSLALSIEHPPENLMFS